MGAVAELERSVRGRDAAGLRRLLARGVELDDALLGSDGEASPLWGRLARALRLGGATAGRGRFVIPWVAAVWPADVPMEGRVAVVVPRTELRLAPSPDARVRAVVGNEVLRVAGAHEPVAPAWIKVRTPGHIYGFVRTEDLWSATEIRIVFEQQRGRGLWKIAALLTGPSGRGGAPPFTIPPAPGPSP